VTIHARSAEEADDAARRLYAVGLLDVAGYAMRLESSEHLEPVGIDELERLVAADSVEVVDVREKDERDEGYIPGSRHIPYRLIRAFRDELDNGRPVVTICSSGARAGVAASVLAAEGVDARPVLDGGIDNWQERGNQVTAFRRCGGSG
jgi:rhodanese-related sulfurtransferase